MTAKAITIRDKAVELLTAYPVASGNVLASWIDTRSADIAPVVGVFVDTEQQTFKGQFPYTVRNETDLAIDAVSTGTTEQAVTESLDEILFDARAALLSNPEFHALLDECARIRVQRRYEAEHNQYIGQGRMTLSLAYFEAIEPTTTPANPADLETAHHEHTTTDGAEASSRVSLEGP